MEAQNSGKSPVWFHLLDVLFNVVVIVAIVAGIRTFLVSPFQVKGPSMTSTLEDREYIIINKLAYFLGDPQRGDVVVFHPPDEPHEFYVKRVIGVPGDEVILRDGRVFILRPEDSESQELEENYLDERNRGKTFRHPAESGSPGESRFLVPPGKYFLLGDNRQDSRDSRSFADINGKPQPFVDDGAIKGKVWFVALPVTKIHAFAPLEYGL